MTEENSKLKTHLLYQQVVCSFLIKKCLQMSTSKIHRHLDTLIQTKLCGMVQAATQPNIIWCSLIKDLSQASSRWLRQKLWQLNSGLSLKIYPPIKRLTSIAFKQPTSGPWQFLWKMVFLSAPPLESQVQKSLCIEIFPRSTDGSMFHADLLSNYR